MTGTTTGPPPGLPGPPEPARSGHAADDEAHLAALLAVLSLTRADAPPHGTPLQHWRARRMAALAEGTRRG